MAGPVGPPEPHAAPPSKVVPPSLPADYVERTRLHALLDESFGHRLTTITAAAGFGKSTLVAAWAADTECAWLTLERSDGSLPQLTAALDASLRRSMPGLPTTFLASGQRSAGAEQAQGREEALAALLCETVGAELDHDLILVLDDVQELGRQSPSARLVRAVCHHAPAALHLLLSSRSEPPFPITRLRGRGEVLAITGSVLAFSDDEIAALLGERLGSASLAEPIHRLTGGWPAAVRLTIEALREVPPKERAAVLETLGEARGSLFGDLTEEAFAREPPALRELMRTVAPLEGFDAELCETLGFEDANTVLTQLARRGFFVQAQGGTRFTLHGLVRDFVTKRWPLEEDELRRVQLGAARSSEQRGNLEAALRDTTAAGDESELARLLREHGRELLHGGAIDVILAAARLLPPAGRDEGIDEVVGEAHALKGEWEDALACYGRASGNGDRLKPGLAWRIGRIHFDRGEPERALEVYSNVRLDGAEPADEALLLAGRAAAELSHGDLAASQRASARSLELASVADDSRARCAAHNIAMVLALRTEPSRADEHHHRGLEAAERAGDVLQAMRIRSNYVAQLLQHGLYEEALAEIEPAVQIGEATGAALALAFALLKRGETRFCLGQLELAVSDFKAARSIYERLGSNRAFGLLMELGEVYRERGDAALARAALEEALRGSYLTEDIQVQVYALANLARVLAAEEPERADELAREALILARRSGHAVVFAQLSSGWVALARGDQDRAHAVAEEGAQAARSRGDRGGLAEALELTALAAAEPEHETAQLESAVAIWRELRNPLEAAKAQLALGRLAHDRRGEARAARRLRELGVRESGAGAGLLALLPRPDPVPLTVQTLGSFGVRRFGKAVPSAEWQSKKARDLLKVLVARRGHRLPREALAEMLWPGEPPEKISNRLSVALSTVRLVLDPERRFGADHFLLADKEAVALRVQAIDLDLERFLQDAESGLGLVRRGELDQALEFLEAAEAAYCGDFLEEDPYEDWAAAPREEARAAYMAVAASLADLADQAADHDRSVRYRLRILERDPYDEGAGLGLVSTLAAARRHGEARRAYSAYVDRMEEIGVEPAPFPSA